MSLEISVSNCGDVRYLEFGRPILTVESLRHLCSELECLAQLPPRPLVVCSRHESVFLAGADLAEIEQLDSDSCINYAERGRRAARLLGSQPGPVIAAVGGSCSGGGFDLVIQTDAIVASPQAVFQHPGIRRGLVTGWSGTTHLPDELGPSRIRSLMLANQPIDAKTMRDLGLVHSLSEDPTAQAVIVARSLATIDRERLKLWRVLKGPDFIDRFRATVVHNLR